jgi:hypothetical protein
MENFSELLLEAFGLLPDPPPHAERVVITPIATAATMAFMRPFYQTSLFLQSVEIASKTGDG